MRIEIIRGHEGIPSYYQIENRELIIGSSQQCHLVLPNPDISRRHLSLIHRGDTYFVIDHGSTNGTFLNEERLEHGVKTEWEVGVPLRLATDVILTLVDDAATGDEVYHPQGRVDENKTMVIPLSQLRAASRTTAPRPRMREKKKEKGMGKAILIVTAILGLAYYLNVEKDIRIKRTPKRKPLPTEAASQIPRQN